MGKIIKLSETQLNRIVTRVIKEQDQPKQEKPKEIKVTDWKIGQEIRNALTNYGFDADFNITPDGWITLKLTLGNTQLIGGYNPKTSAQKFNLTSGGQSLGEILWNGDIGDFIKDIFKKITLNENITKKVTINEINKLIKEQDDDRAMQDMTKDIEKRGTKGSFRRWCKRKNKNWNGCSTECWDAAMATNRKSLHDKVAGAKFYCD